MGLNRRWCVWAAVVCCATVPVARGASRIVLVDASASASSTYTKRDAKYAVNGEGLTGGQHNADVADYKMWMSNNTSSTPTGQWFRVDLGANLPLDSFRLWNFNWKHATVDTLSRGVKDAEVYLSQLATDPGSTFSDTSKWTRVINKVTFAKAPGVDTYTGEPAVSLQGHSARWLALRILSNFGNSQKEAGIAELQVFASEEPTLISVTPTAVDTAQATLPGTLTYNAGLPTAVQAYWGTTDGGTVSSAWQNVVSLGTRPVGPLSATVSVAANNAYAFRFRALSAGGTNWSGVNHFITAPVAVELPASVEEGSGVVPVTLRRPAAFAAVPLALSIGVSGTVIAGEDYALSNPTVVMPAGAETVQASVPLIDDVIAESAETLVVGLGPSACVRTAASTNSVTIVDDDALPDTTQWRFHMKVRLSGYSGASALTNFPCALRLSESVPGFRYADFASPGDGGDLRVTDDVTGQPILFEIDTWDPAGTSVVWVRVPVLSGNSTTVRLHWGNAAASLPAYATNGKVWSSGFGGVWHLRQSSALDSSPNGNHGTANGNTPVVGILGQGQYFNGASFVQVPDHASIGAQVTGALTVSAWMKSDVALTSGTETYRMLEKGDDYFLAQGYTSAGGVVFLVKRGNTPTGVGNGADVAGGVWRHVCGTYDGTTIRLYLSGVQVGSAALGGAIDDDALPLRIGSDDSGKFFLGAMDETRVESVARSADWVKACYDSQRQNATFAAYGQVTSVAGSTIFIF